MAKRSKDKQAPPPEDPRLRDILYTINAHRGRGGLCKLVPCSEHLGWPAFTFAGDFVRDEDPTVPRYLRVELTASYDYHGKEWSDRSQGWACCITITDGDDYILQRWLPFTYADWCIQVDCYNSLKELNQALLQHLTAIGFG